MDTFESVQLDSIRDSRLMDVIVRCPSIRDNQR